MRQWTMLAVIIFLALTTSVLAQSKPMAPDFSLKTSDGKVIQLDQYKGKVVVVNFWATWCPPCRQEIPGFLKVYKSYRSKGLEIIGIALDQEGWEVVTPFVKKQKLTYPVVIGTQDVVRKFGGIQSIPTTFLVDKSGTVVKRQVGYWDEQEFETAVKALLE
ncbi:MAG: TlpA disulfide reductase family protein [bacterium]